MSDAQNVVLRISMEPKWKKFVIWRELLKHFFALFFNFGCLENLPWHERHEPILNCMPLERAIA
jgi:hypothetical protein